MKRDLWHLVIALAAFAAAGVGTVGCSSVKQGWSGTREHKPLLEQIVRMRSGHKGITHQTCVELDWWGKCSKSTLLEYDLNDAQVRARFIALGFVCELGGRRYKIDPDAAQFVRYQRKRPCWLCKEETTKVEPVPFKETQKLLDAALVCYSERVYPSGLH